MVKKIFRLLEVIVEGLFSGKCDSCHYWKCCPAQRESTPGWAGKAQVSGDQKTHLCPVFDWVEKIGRSETIVLRKKCGILSPVLPIRTRIPLLGKDKSP